MKSLQELENGYVNNEALIIAHSMIVLDRDKALAIAELIRGMCMLDEIEEKQTYIDFEGLDND